MKNTCFIIGLIVLFFASCGNRNISSENSESVYGTDTIAVASELTADVKDVTVSEPVIRIDTLSAEDVREALLTAMAQDSAPQYNGGSYTRLRQMPDSLKDILINQLISSSTPNCKQYISTAEWECVLERLPDSDILGFKEYSDTTFYFLISKYVIDVTNKTNQNNFRREITRDFAVDDSIGSIKNGFVDTGLSVKTITPDTVKIDASYCLEGQAFVYTVSISIPKDGNVSIGKSEFFFSGSEEDDW